jgi:hypothetical protein
MSQYFVSILLTCEGYFLKIQEDKSQVARDLLLSLWHELLLHPAGTSSLDPQIQNRNEVPDQMLVNIFLL